MPERPDLDNRSGFDRIASHYDRARHGYPAALFDDLFSMLPARSRIVEVGPGTGQATGDLLERGAEVIAVELGASMARRLRANLGHHDNLGEIVVGPFESSTLPAGSFDAVFSATAYHWVPTEAQTAEPARILRPDGVLAVVDTIQVEAPEDAGFWTRIQTVFEAHGAGRRPGEEPPAPDQATPGLLSTLHASDDFSAVEFRRYRWDQQYSTDEYCALHRTTRVGSPCPSRPAKPCLRTWPPSSTTNTAAGSSDRSSSPSSPLVARHGDGADQQVERNN